MNQQDIINRIKYLIKELNYKQADFARKIDVDTSNLSKYLNGRLPLSESLINRIVVNMGVSKQWLEEGSDLPFAKPIAPAALQVAPAALLDTHHGTPVYDIDVTAGAMPRSRMFTDDQIVGWIDLPEVANSEQRIVRVNLYRQNILGINKFYQQWKVVAERIVHLLSHQVAHVHLHQFRQRVAFQRDSRRHLRLHAGTARQLPALATVGQRTEIFTQNRVQLLSTPNLFKILRSEF